MSPNLNGFLRHLEYQRESILNQLRFQESIIEIIEEAVKTQQERDILREQLHCRAEADRKLLERSFDASAGEELPIKDAGVSAGPHLPLFVQGFCCEHCSRERFGAFLWDEQQKEFRRRG